MKLGGKAFVAGFCGWLGMASALGVTVVFTGFVAQRQLKRLMTRLETE